MELSRWSHTSKGKDQAHETYDQTQSRLLDDEGIRKR